MNLNAQPKRPAFGRLGTFWLLFPTLLFCIGEARAQNLSDRVSLHGFGGWGFGRTDGNSYLFGAEDPEYDHAMFSLNLSALISDEVKAVAQMSWETGQTEDLSTELDYVFAEWTLSDALRLRFGRVKQPFGIYTEIFDVGTVRPFLNLPPALYGPQGFTAKSFNGIGATGSLFGDGGWGFDYDLYGGSIDINIDLATLLAAVEPLFDEQDAYIPTVRLDLELDDVIGGRAQLTTPINGLMFGASFFTAKLAEDGPDAFAGNWLVAGAHMDYQNDTWLVRSEYAVYDLDGSEPGESLNSEGLYLELAHRFGPAWQVALRYDWWELKPAPPDFAPPAFRDLGLHRDLAIGLNYWLSAGFVLKWSVHRVRGNRFAYPHDLESAQAFFEQFILERDTNLFQFGVQFSF